MTYGTTKSYPNSCRRLCMKTREIRARVVYTALIPAVADSTSYPSYPFLSLSLYTPARAPEVPETEVFTNPEPTRE